MARRWIPRICVGVFVLGIAGIIVATINGNNPGVIMSLGLAIALAVVALLTSSAVTGQGRIDVFDDAAAERVERLVAELVAAGADEATVRALVRETRRLGRQ